MPAMFGSLIKKIKAGNLWHLVWMGVIASEILTVAITAVMSIYFHGIITHDYIITGAVTASIVAAVVISIIIYLVRKWQESEDYLREAQEQVNRKAEMENYAKNLEHVVTLRTERLNNALKELQQQKDFSDKLLSAIGATIAVLDCEGRIVRVNKAWEEFTEEDVKGKYIWDFMPEKSVHLAKMTLEEMLINKTATTFKISVLTKDGGERIVLANNAVIEDENGEVRYIIATGIDITEKEMMEEHLMETQRLQSIATLVTGLSHNFNNILVGILGYAGLLRIKLSESDIRNTIHDTDKLLKYIDTIENSVKKASEFIKHLMMFSKKTEYVKKDVSLDEIVGDMLDIIKSSFPKNILMESKLNGNPCRIKADKDRLQQALINICINAKDAMPEGGRLRIETLSKEIIKPEHMLQRFGTYAIIKISDTGHGMDEETRRKIFEPFFTTKGPLHHTGLGLSIAHSIVREHNGYIAVDNNREAEKGTTFTVYLPAA